MKKNMRVAGGIAVMVAALCVTALSQGSAPEKAPPAGEYMCLVSSLDMMNGDVSLQFAPSAFGRLVLDGKGAYKLQASGKTGRYSYNPGDGKFTFATGPLQDWPAAYWKDGSGKMMIRLAKSMTASLNPKGPSTGEHRCRLRN